MAKLYNLARMTTATTGTGTLTLGSAVSGFLTFAQAGVVNSDVVAYGIRDGANSEVGTGTYTSAGTTLTRTVTKSTNADAAISLSGAAQVFITALKEQIGNLTEANTWTGIQTYNNGGDHFVFGSPAAGAWYDSLTHANGFYVGTDSATDAFRIYTAGLADNAFVVNYTTGAITTVAAVSNIQSLAANTSGDGFVLSNPTAATSGNQRHSPRIRLTGQGWKTDATAASQTVDWIIENRPVQGTANPATKLFLGTQINAGGYSERFSIADDNTNTAGSLLGVSSTRLDFYPAGAAALVLYSDASQTIIGTSAATNVNLYSVSLRAYIPSAGGFVVGNASSALATNATDGFLYIPTCAGTPTGTPTTQTGTVPMVYDTTNNKLYIRSGGAWKGGTAPGTWS